MAGVETSYNSTTPTIFDSSTSPSPSDATVDKKEHSIFTASRSCTLKPTLPSCCLPPFAPQPRRCATPNIDSRAYALWNLTREAFSHTPRKQWGIESRHQYRLASWETRPHVHVTVYFDTAFCRPSIYTKHPSSPDSGSSSTSTPPCYGTQRPSLFLLPVQQ